MGVSELCKKDDTISMTPGECHRVPDFFLAVRHVSLVRFERHKIIT
jgi:hypothetical protein